MGKLFGFLTKNIAEPIEGIANTALSLFRDKVRDGDTSFIREKIKKGVSLSSKRILNITGTAAIITIAISLIQKNGVTKENLILLAVGVAYSTAMAFITAYSERNK